MELYSKEIINEILEVADIIEVIEEDVGELQKESGNEYAGYHSNKHSSKSETSLKVNSDKGLYHCFNCGEGGSIINWLINNRGMEFLEAVRYLAAKYGVELNDMTEEEKERMKKHFKNKEKLAEIYDKVADIYNSQLTEEIYQIIKDKWGIDKETADKFKIGFAPADGAFLKQTLIKAGYNWSFLKKTGLFIIGKDHFQGRIVFPYYKNKKPAFFIARRTKYTPDNKYETGKYKKIITHSSKNSHILEEVENNIFFGEDTVGDSNLLIITEGITDAITTIAKGFPCVSPVTVQFREKDYHKLNRLANKTETIYIANDNEDSGAGQKGALKTAEFLHQNGHDVRVVNLPRHDEDKVDLAEYWKENSEEDFRKLLDKAKNPLEIKIEKVANASDHDKKIKLADDVYPLFLNLDSITREIYESKLHKAFDGIRISTIREMIENNLNELKKEKKQRQDREKDEEYQSMIAPLKESKEGYYFEKTRVVKNAEITESIFISNFLLNISEIYKSQVDGGETLVGEISYFDGDKEKVEIDYKAFSSTRNFIESLPIKAVWKGSNHQLQELKVNIDQQDPTKKKLFDIAGRHKQEIILPGITIDENGPIEEAKNIIENLNNNQFLESMPSIWPSKKDHINAAEKIFEYLPKINEPAIAGALIGWNFALPWFKLIRSDKSWGGAPHLILFGEAGCGKTQSAKLIWRLNGINSSYEPFSLPNTRFTRIHNYSLTNLVPLILDEYRPEAWTGYKSRQIHEELRNLYNANIAERGRANLTTKVYSLSAPIVLCGEDRPRDTTGLEERMIILNPNKDIVDGNSDYGDICKESFKELQKAPLEAFALHYYSWCLTQNDWLKELNASREAIINFGDAEDLNFPERIINNLSILNYGWNKFQQYAEFLGIQANGLI
ncbi:MAG: CHC2 zinc finger domain-containing protein, partial [Halanaerobiales bacterium]